MFAPTLRSSAWARIIPAQHHREHCPPCSFAVSFSRQSRIQQVAIYSAGVRYCAGEIVWHNIDPSTVAGFYIVRVPGIVRVNIRDTYPHYIGPPTVYVYG